MNTSLLRFRDDLIVLRQETAEGTFFIVKDADSGDFYRFREAEHFIALQLDGETPLEVVRERAEEKFGATLDTETLKAFVKNLEKTGLLETEDAKKKHRRSRRRIQGSLLYLRFKAFDPSQLFDRLIHRVRFFFTPHFLTISSLLILLAALTTIVSWDEFAKDLPRLYQLSSIPLFLVVIFLVISLHEFAHGLTCKHFGGDVHEIGFMLIYFQPALYCNVSDAWLFPEKSKRLWVGFAGPYFELFLWALATLAWRVTDEQTWINYLALIVMTSSGIKTLFNFNPFIKLDGYYLLSDYLELPNMRRKSFRYVGGLIKGVFGLDPPMTTEISPRERRIYLSYGLVATISSFSLLAYVLFTAGSYLIENHQPTALAIVSGLASVKFRRRIRKLFGKGGSSDPEDDGDDLATSNPGESARPAEPKKKKRIRWKRWMTWTSVSGASLVVLFFGRMELRIAGPFNILPEENADVRTAVEGIIETIYVDEGDEVKAGEVIARLSDRLLRAELLKVESDLAAKRARLNMLLAGPIREEIELARKAVETGTSKHRQALELYLQAKRTREEKLALSDTAIKKAEERLQFAEKNLEMFRTLVQEGLGSRKQLDEAAEQAAVRKRELEEARVQRQVLLAEDLAETRTDVEVTEKLAKEAEGKLQVLLAGTRKEEIQALEAEIKRAETEQAYLREQIECTRIGSPVAGIVATPSRELKAMRNQLVKKGDLIAKVYDFDTVTAQIAIPEKEIAGIQVGQRVAVRTRAYPDLEFYGKVTSIATSARGSSGSGSQTGFGAGSAIASTGADKTVLVTTQISNQSLLLKPELTGQAKIYCGNRRFVDLIKRRLDRTFKVEFWSWW